MHRAKKESAFRDFILIVAGCTLLAFGVKSIFDPSGLVTGGISGLSILIKDLTSEWIPGGIPLWATTLCLNAPLFLAAFFMKGFRYIKKTLFATVFLSLVLEMCIRDRNEALSELLAKEVQLAYQEAQLQSTETQLQGIQLILNGASGSMKDLMDKLEKARAELEAIKNNNTLPEEEKTELIRQLEEQIAKLEAQLKGISDTLEAMGMTVAGTLEDMSADVYKRQR